MLFGNKLLRKQEKLINDTIKELKKAKKSQNCTSKMEGNKEVYYLDNIDISFDVMTRKLVVAFKNGTRIFTMDCAFSLDSDQSKKFQWFSALLDEARNVYENVQKQQAKKVKMREGKAKLDSAKKVKEKQKEILMAEEAHRRFKSL